VGMLPRGRLAGLSIESEPKTSGRKALEDPGVRGGGDYLLLGDGFEEEERLRSSIDVHIEHIELTDKEREEG